MTTSALRPMYEMSCLCDGKRSPGFKRTTPDKIEQALHCKIAGIGSRNRTDFEFWHSWLMSDHIR
jgi:hypothetical protein